MRRTIDLALAVAVCVAAELALRAAHWAITRWAR